MSMRLMPLRPPILDQETESKLKEELTPLWESGKLGPEIAQALRFGEPGPYEKLKPHHVYYYRQKFDLQQRARHYKFGKLGQDTIPGTNTPVPKIVKNTTDIELFKTYLDNVGRDPKSRIFYVKRKRAYLILVYQSGLRKSEIYELKRNEFKIDETGITLNAVRKKKRKKEVLPLFLPRALWGINEAIEWIEGFEDPHERPFPISSTTAWKYVKEMAEELYPHYFRANLVTQLCDDPDMTIIKLRSWFGFSVAMIEHYLGAQERVQKREAFKRAQKEGQK